MSRPINLTPGIKLKDLNIQLGDLVLFDVYYKRQRSDAQRRIWYLTPCRETSGIIVGIRTLSNGKVRYWGRDEGGTEYTPTEYFRTLIVSTSLSAKLKYIPLQPHHFNTSVVAL